MTSKYYARVDYSYAGDSKFTIPFSCIKKEHIVVFVNEEQTTNYTYITSSQIEVKDILQAGDNVSIRRKTPIDEKIVNFNNLNILNGETQNLAQEQVLNSVQEIYDENVSFQIDLDNQIIELEQNVDEKVAAVSDAVEKLNILDESIKTTVEAAEVAVEARDQTFDISEQIIEECQQSLAGCEQKVQDCETLTTQAKEYVDTIDRINSNEIGDIGIAPLGIDETQGKRRYLNGQVIIQDQYVQFTEKVKSAVALYPTLACTETEWQATALLTVGGQVGKFVVDDDAGTIRLPKIIMPIQGLTDLSKLGEIVEAGLPNIEGVQYGVCGASGSPGSTSGAFSSTQTGTWAMKDTTGGSKVFALTFDASLSNSIHGNSNTVQQEQIQYPYFIQVATGAETEDNIINEIELNNPFSLLDYKYSEYELNNLSWLRSEGQYNSKAIYPAVYDLLLKIYNGTEIKAGVSVKLSTETFTDYDFVLNTAEETFRLPIKVKLASGKAVVGNGMTLGLTDGINLAGLANITSSNPHLYGGTVVGGNVGDTAGTTTGLTSGKCIGITTDPTKSGIELSDSDLYLYFYVGETVQNANLINAGRIQEKVAECLTRSNKNEITSWIMPDWSNAIDYANNTTVNTAPANGYVVMNYNYQGSANGQFKINGTIIGTAVGNSSYRGVLNGMYVVNKGDTFQITQTATSDSSTPLVYKFVPMKGAN